MVTLILIMRSTDEMLRESLNQASETISNLSASIGAYNTFFMIISVIIGILTIALPVLTYLFGIRPSQKAIKELQENFDEKYEAYRKRSRENEVNTAIQNLRSENKELKMHAINFLTLTKYDGFSNQQLSELFAILNLNETDDSTKNVISLLLTSKKNVYASDFFKKAIYDTKFTYNALLYFSNFDPDYILEYLKSLVDQSKSKSLDFLNAISAIGILQKNAVSKIVDNKAFLDSLPPEVFQVNAPVFNTTMKHINIDEKAYIFEKVKEASNH